MHQRCQEASLQHLPSPPGSPPGLASPPAQPVAPALHLSLSQCWCPPPPQIFLRCVPALSRAPGFRGLDAGVWPSGAPCSLQPGHLCKLHRQRGLLCLARSMESQTRRPSSRGRGWRVNDGPLTVGTAVQLRRQSKSWGSPRRCSGR